MESLVTAPTPTMIGHGFPPGPIETALNRAFDALIERCKRAEARVRELETLLAAERKHREHERGEVF